MKKPTNDIISKFYSNNCTKSERELVINYLTVLDEAEQNTFLDNHLKSLENIETPHTNTTDFNKILEKVNSKGKSESRRRNYTFSIAASIGFLFILSATLLYFINSNNSLKEIKWNEKETKLGQKSIITLLDGTRITLNAESKLLYPSKFGEISREVHLSGEAYFEVTHMSETPFIVHSDRASTTVLGTKFNVKAFSDEEEVSVSLVEGSVKVSNKYAENIRNDIKLSKGQQVSINKDSGVEDQNTFDPLQVTGWKDNVLVFKNAPILDVFKMLSRTYGVKFELKEYENKFKRITINFDNESFWAIVKVIKKVTKLNYFTIEADSQLSKIVFTKKQVANGGN